MYDGLGFEVWDASLTRRGTTRAYNATYSKPKVRDGGGGDDAQPCFVLNRSASIFNVESLSCDAVGGV